MNIRKLLSLIGGNGFGTRELPLFLLLKYLLIQKLIGINRKASWPVHWTSRIKSPENIERGTRFPGLSPFCYIDARNGIKLSENVWVGPGVALVSMNHDSTDYNNYITDEPIIISKNCWLGANAIILPGVKLGEHTIVAAGAIVTKPFDESNIVLAGNPARIIKYLKPYR